MTGKSTCISAFTLTLVGVVSTPAIAQQPERVAKDDAVLVVDGVVRQIYRSPRQHRTNVLVQIEVQRAEARRAPKTAMRPHVPLPGEFVYVNVFQEPKTQGFLNRVLAHSAIPNERAQVRAYLIARDHGEWEGTFPDWFDVTSDRVVEASKNDPAPSVAEAPREQPGSSNLGMTFEPQKLKDRLVLRVKSVERGSVAQQAGLEVGDVIIGAKGDVLKSAQQIEELARTGEPIPLIVMDVNTSRAAQVELRPNQPKPADSTVVVAKPAAVEKRTLGLAAEPVKLDQRTALKVTRVEPGGPAQKAGLEVGDVLVAANGAAITSPEQLGNALRKSGPVLKLTVRDSRTGREVPVDVAIGGPNVEVSLPAGVPEVRPSGQKLGAVTELTFYDVEAAVKITEVEPNSPAARAGLQVGTVILEANGKPILHPNDLNDAVRASTGTLTLSVVDPRTGRKGTVQVNLG